MRRKCGPVGLNINYQMTLCFKMRLKGRDLQLTADFILTGDKRPFGPSATYSRQVGISSDRLRCGNVFERWRRKNKWSYF